MSASEDWISKLYSPNTNIEDWSLHIYHVSPGARSLSDIFTNHHHCWKESKNSLRLAHIYTLELTSAVFVINSIFAFIFI